ncbi:MAG: hypothetical protein MUE73_00435 [Planctomycetes bacterium]|jgi:membrane-bound serine protease (ClpP class)|nr:hypothetical protein [Planctomycetota bacterium]
MEQTLALVLLVVSMGLVLLEAFIPSMGLLTIASLASLAGSLVFGFRTSTTFGFVLVGAALVGIPLLLWVGFRVFPKTGLGRSMILAGPPAAGPRVDPLAGFLGKEGVALSLLRPSGVAEIDGKRVDVVTRGEIAEAGVRIVVIDCSGNRILVRLADDQQGGEQ